MASRYFSEFPEKKVSGGASPPPTGRKGAKSPPVKFKTAKWGTGPTSGVRWGVDTAKVKVYPKSKGVASGS